MTVIHTRVGNSSIIHPLPVKAINRYLLDNALLIADNPCISPDFCLDWDHLAADIRVQDGVREYALSEFDTADGSWRLVRNTRHDFAWKLAPAGAASPVDGFHSGKPIGGALYYPASYENLIVMKNRVQDHDPGSTIFPTAGANLGKSTLGIGARFTSLHWPAVDWTMSHLGLGLTANQNSIPRELVYDVDSMLAGKLDTVPFPFIGTDVPEGHQGQSVEGMSHGCILAKLITGFHLNRLQWCFNADHQPIGGKFDDREDQLVAGCLFATYITFDLSPELARTMVPEDAAARREFVDSEMGPEAVRTVSARVEEIGLNLSRDELDTLLCYVWPAMVKMRARDEKYRLARQAAFTTETGRAYLRELSIDELPGVTAPETTAVMLALSEWMGMPVNFVAPAFGFQKNAPFPDNGRLRQLISAQWKVCKAFGTSIGFHSGSGKSAENYRVMGEVTGGNLEIKTSGRYTYEMGVALAQSDDPADAQLWENWYDFTRELAVQGAFSDDNTERSMAREFIENALQREGCPQSFGTLEACERILNTLSRSPDHMFWFEYNFLFVLAAGGSADKHSLGDHSPAGYRQRARFYSISDAGRLNYAKGVAGYIIFLAENTGLVDSETCRKARARLETLKRYTDFLNDIAPARKNPNP